MKTIQLAIPRKQRSEGEFEIHGYWSVSERMAQGAAVATRRLGDLGELGWEKRRSFCPKKP